MGGTEPVKRINRRFLALLVRLVLYAAAVGIILYVFFRAFGPVIQFLRSK